MFFDFGVQTADSIHYGCNLLVIDNGQHRGVDFYRNLAAAIDGEVEQVVTHAQVMRVMKVMEAAFASDAAGVPVKLEGDEIAKYKMVY